MEEQFVTYDLALKLKELGFKNKGLGFIYMKFECEGVRNAYVERVVPNYLYGGRNLLCIAPIWQEVFDWFMEKYNLFVKFDFFQSDEFKGVDYDYCIIDLNKPFKEDGISDNPLVDYSVNETYYFNLQEAR